MAILHGDTAQWPKLQAEKKFHLILISYATLSMLSGALFGIGAVLNHFLLGTASAVAGILFLVLAARALDQPMRELGKERIRHWRGAQTESLVALIIKYDLDNTWHLFNSIKLTPNRDIDHILVGPAGIFAISTKSQRGLYTHAPDGSLLINLKPSNFARQAASQAAELHNYLKPILGPETPFIQPILAAPFAFTDLNEKSQTTWVLHQENLSDTLEQLPKSRLTHDQLRQILATLKPLTRITKQLTHKPPATQPPAT